MSKVFKWILERLAYAMEKIDMDNEQKQHERFSTDGTPEGNYHKFMMETSGGFHATNEDWTTVGMDASGYPVPKGSAEDVTPNATPDPTQDVEEIEAVEHTHKWKRGVLPGQKYVKQCACGKMEDVTFADWQNLA